MAPPKTPLIDYTNLPQSLREGVRNYVEGRIRPGSFLSACLQNDLRLAVMNADSDNRECLSQIVTWMHFELPDYCWGSREKFEKWLAARK